MSLPKITAVTHAGHHHGDEVLATWFLQQVFGSRLTVVRTSDPEVMRAADILYDCGGECDPEAGRFDHHSSAILPLSPEGRVVGYATAGLVWRQWGTEIVRNYITGGAGHSWEALKANQNEDLIGQMAVEITQRMDQEFVAPIDAWDQGIRPDKRYFGRSIPMQWILSQLEFDAAVEALGSAFTFRLQSLVNSAGDAWRLQADLVDNGPTEFFENEKGILVVAAGSQRVDVIAARQSVFHSLGLTCMGVISPLRQGTRWALFLTEPLSPEISIPCGIEYLANRRCFYHSKKEVLQRLAMASFPKTQA